MGASLSNMGEAVNGSTIGPGLGDIPENCVARVFLHLTPPEICNLARLNRAFRGAASSDAVWETKLPSNYQDLLDFLPPERYQNLSKKDIYALLSRPVPFDDGNKVVRRFPKTAFRFVFVLSLLGWNLLFRVFCGLLFSEFDYRFESYNCGGGGVCLWNFEPFLQEVWLDRITGRICMSISAKGMAITGIDDRRYWNWIPTEESRLDSDNPYLKNSKISIHNLSL